MKEEEEGPGTHCAYWSMTLANTFPLNSCTRLIVSIVAQVDDTFVATFTSVAFR